jgi:hypothetical protein
LNRGGRWAFVYKKQQQFTIRSCRFRYNDSIRKYTCRCKDFLNRAVPDPTDKENGLSMVIKDYPYAVDGLEIWAALKYWVSDYTTLYYKYDHAVQSDKEVQAWWKEIMEVGRGDKKHDETGWCKMKSVEDVIESINTLIWIASSHHAAVNFR